MSKLDSTISLSPCMFVLIVATAMPCLSTPAAAQDKSFKYELAPIVGFRTGGSFDEDGGPGEIELEDSNALGLMFNIKAHANGQYEFLYSRQSTDARTEGFLVNDPTIDMDVENFHIGGTYLFDGDNTRPFMAVTVGATRFDPGLADTSTETFFSFSVGGGVQLNATKRFGVRLEARVFATLVDDDTDFICRSSPQGGGCLIQVDATTVTQWEARAGLVYRF